MAIFVTGDTHGAHPFSSFDINGYMFRFNTHNFPEQKEMTVGEWLDTWLKEYLADVKQGTSIHYESVVRLHLKPALGDIMARWICSTNPTICPDAGTRCLRHQRQENLCV